MAVVEEPAEEQSLGIQAPLRLPPGRPGPDPARTVATTLAALAALEPEPPADGFRDLLGQAVGLRLDDVHRSFAMGEVEVRALQGISLEIGPAEYVAVTGPSGCGKSTLLALLGGLDRPTAGHVYAAGTALDQIPEAELADYRLQRVGTIFQVFNLVPTLSAEDNVALPMALAGVPLQERRERARRLLQLVGLEGRARFRPSRLSGGEQQRVAVARALANRPGLVLADEPTGNLDSGSGKLVLDLLDDLHRRGATVILVSHDPEIARRADRVLRLRDGRLGPIRRGRRTLRNQELIDPPRRLKWQEAFWLGVSSIFRRPLRTGLTAAGVAIGIGVMCLILSLAAGLQTAVVDSARAQGQLLQVQVENTNPDGVGRKPLDPAALTRLERLPHVTAAWGQVVVQGTFSYGRQSADLPARPGVLVSLEPVRYQPPLNSRLLLAGRLPASNSAPEVVLSADAVRQLGFDVPQQALGRTVLFQGRYNGVVLPGSKQAPAAQTLTLPLTVVGIARSGPLPIDLHGGSVPYDVATKYWSRMAQANGWPADEFQRLTLLADSPDNVEVVRDEARAAGFPATSPQNQLIGIPDLLNYLELALVGLAGIALVVACLGIINTMYTAVLERTREIGVLKAVGARSRDVLELFVAEAAVIGALGGVIGVALAALLAALGNRVLNGVAQSRGGDFELQLFQVDVLLVIGGVVLAIALSAVSGILPALRAAAQDPAAALRYE
ncbi:MAG TPA: ATP-binding cassette domain-containing protein [Candidatus Acidoferrales bacterium]|nr:ATP-binding cassette domain-containing protein [Candidatus Acidoferrales bacterium]